MSEELDNGGAGWYKNEPSSKPKNPGFYLVYCPNSSQLKIHIAHFNNDEWSIIDYQYNNGISHWRELPGEPEVC